MQTRKSSFTKPLVIAALGCLVFAAVACGDDDDNGNPAPAGGTKATGGTESTAGKSGTTGGTSGTAGKTGTAGTNNEPTGGGGAGPDMTDTGGAGGEAPASCTDDADRGCYSCKPKTLDQFLNACPTTGCEPFNNANLKSITKAGKLPALP